MIYRVGRLYLFGVFICLFTLVGIALHPGKAHAFTFPRAQDVAIQGSNAAIDDPYGHYVITSTSGNPDVFLHNACLDSTAGSPGLSASLNGITKSSFAGTSDCGSGSGCSNNDLCFYNVPSGSMLTVHKINGQGHQPFSVEAINAAGAHITQRANPNHNSGTWSDSDGDNYGVNVWGDADLSFVVPCSVAPGTDVWIKWKDADVRQEDQRRPVSAFFNIYYPDGTFLISTPVRIDQQQVNNQPGAKKITVDPGYRYQWQWENVQSGNVIQHLMPFEDTPQNCAPPRARCTATVSNSFPIAGTNVNIRLVVTNTGTTQWPASIVVTGAANHNPPALNPGGSRTYNDTFSRASPGEVDYTYRIQEPGGIFGPDTYATCTAAVFWQSQVQITQSTCGNLQISNPTNSTFRLRFVDTTTNTEVALSPTYPQPFSIPPQTSYNYNLFVSFNFMVPHHTYYIEARNNALTSTYDAKYVNNNQPCISASCFGGISAGTEPGQRSEERLVDERLVLACFLLWRYKCRYGTWPAIYCILRRENI
jgi:hypothetical protein